MASTAADEDYEHWPDDPKLATAPAEPVPRYDSRNGYREHTYRPSGDVKVSAPAAPKQDVAAPPQYMPYPQMMAMGGGGQMPYLAYPASAYYGYGYNNVPAGVPSIPPTPIQGDRKERDPLPGPPGKKDDTKPTPKAPYPRKWQGRTRAEVEEDDMKIAASEGAYAPRKVVPVGMADEQVVWVVEVDGEHSLRTFAEANELEGEWKLDPRFRDAWYFVRHTEEAEGEGEK